MVSTARGSIVESSQVRALLVTDFICVETVSPHRIRLCSRKCVGVSYESADMNLLH